MSGSSAISIQNMPTPILLATLTMVETTSTQLDDVDFLAKHRARIEIVNAQRNASERFDEMFLNCAQSICATKILRDAIGNSVKLLSR